MTACSAGDCPGVKKGRIFARSLARSRLFVHQYKVVDAFCWGSGDAIECCASMLDRTGALIGEKCNSSCYREGVPTVVVFEISPSHVKTFHHRPQHSQPPPPGPIALLCDVFALALSLNFEDPGL